MSINISNRRIIMTPALASGSSSQVLPSDLTGLIAWYKADTGVTSGGNNTSVTAWADQSGTGSNLVQTGDPPPKFFTAGFNGLNSVTFDATAAPPSILVSSSFAIGTGNKISVFVVGQMLSATASFGRAISYTKSGGADDFGNAGSAAIILRDSTNNGIASYANSVERVTDPISLATNYRLGMIYDGTNITPYVNAVAGTPAAYSTAWVSAGTLSVGRDFLGSAGWSGAISEIVIATSDCTSQVTGLDNYFKNKWGL